ncbi:hypothetical protein [Spongiactinospora sp. 9N601]|uniref:hypothetical protein n=1 Tax=Spongiactinospora sp. 9N601 TaxID=3375149 RepID=UPI0037AA1AC5
MRRAIADIDSRRARLVRTLQITDNPIGDLVQDIHARAARLAEERAAKHRELGGPSASSASSQRSEAA